MAVSIRGRLPSGDKNGLAHVEPQLSEDPTTEVVAIVRLASREVVEKVGSDEFEYRMGVVQIEALLDPGDRDFALAQLRSAHENRTGRPSLPFGADTVDRNDG